MKFKWLFVLLLLVSSVSAVCTVTLNKDSYGIGETASVTANCDANEERNKAYTITWYNETDDVQQTDSGTTPATVSTDFFETFAIPLSYSGLNITGNMTGTSLEGDDLATVTAVASNQLVIDGFAFSAAPYLIDETFGVHVDISDENGKGISGALCDVVIEDVNSNPVVKEEVRSFDSNIHTDFHLVPHAFDEASQYQVNVFCYCGKASTSSSCVDEDGVEVELSSGSGSEVFSTDTWLSVNTVTDSSSYVMKEELFVCANVTNVNSTARVPMEIFHQVRCSGRADNDDDRDRTLVMSDNGDPDKRGIGVGSTQMQCKVFKVPEYQYLEGKDNECYASTEVWVIDDEGKYVKGYASTSPVFNITSSELNLNPDWERVDDYMFQSVVNLSDASFRDWDGDGVGQVDLKLTALSNSLLSYENFDLPTVDFTHLVSTEVIHNFTVVNASGQHYRSALEYLDDGSLEIEIKDAEMDSTGYFVINMTLHDFEERSVDALEGIEASTGSFRMSVECPYQGIVGGYLSCVVEAQVEDGSSDKEVGFECWIPKDDGKSSVVEFNKMITSEVYSVEKEFAVHSSFGNAEEHSVVCEGRYYDLGLKEIVFSDAFLSFVDPGSVVPGGGPGVVPPVVEVPLPDVPEVVPEPQRKSLLAGLAVGGIVGDGELDYFLLGCLFVLFLWWRRKNGGKEEFND